MKKQNHQNSAANLLATEKSPYLKQHASNPIHWHAWNDETLLRAKTEDKPIFLSIGYSTCHWCHVMARESFADREVAEIMNEVFVSIKVDREERPDIDAVFMQACQMMTGGGGWPLSLILTPERKPIFAGTYLPKFSVSGRIGMLDLAHKMGQLWRDHRTKVLADADHITQTLCDFTESEKSKVSDTPGICTPDLSTLAFNALASSFDDKFGGFGAAPKFPTAQNLLFLLRYWRRTGDTTARHMVEKTLLAMQRGGIFDQLGHGFHRYSTDQRWLLPHFEKMLYDQAMLALAYTEAACAFDDTSFATTAKQTIDYVLRDLSHPEGGFCSAEDADSEGEEGRFYVFTLAQVADAVGPDNAALAEKYFSLAALGNFTDEASGKRTGANILIGSHTPNHVAAKFGLDELTLEQRLTGIKEKLLAVRAKRSRPGLDNKVLTDWNGLMIAALARAGKTFGMPEYIDRARKAADFLLTRMQDKGTLRHRYCDGDAAIAGYLDDYAFLVFGLHELYEATVEDQYLDAATHLLTRMIELFWDKRENLFSFSNKGQHESFFAHPRQLYDGAIPSGNSMALYNLLKLGCVTGNDLWLTMANSMANRLAMEARQIPAGHTFFLTAVEAYLFARRLVTVHGNPDDTTVRHLLQRIGSTYLPEVIVHLAAGQHDQSLSVDICLLDRCLPPEKDPEKILGILHKNIVTN